MHEEHQSNKGSEPIRLVIRRSRNYSSVGLLVLPIMLVLACYALFQGGLVVAIVLVVAATVATITSIVAIKDRGPQIIIESDGIVIPGLSSNKLCWSEIQSVSRESWPRGTEVIALQVTTEAGDKIRFPVHGLSASPDTIRDMIVASLRTYRQEANDSD